jgi:hypothetical protein
VLIWQPPMRVAFSFHPGRDEREAQTVEVTFSQAPGGNHRRADAWRLGETRCQRAASPRQLQPGMGGSIRERLPGIRTKQKAIPGLVMGPRSLMAEATQRRRLCTPCPHAAICRS